MPLQGPELSNEVAGVTCVNAGLQEGAAKRGAPRMRTSETDKLPHVVQTSTGVWSLTEKKEAVIQRPHLCLVRKFLPMAGKNNMPDNQVSFSIRKLVH